MNIRFKDLKITNFKSHKDLTINFGEVTKILGDNREGKSTIVETPVWLLYGTDTFGSKLDPTPVTYEADATEVIMIINVDGKDTVIGRELKKGKTKYYIDDVPKKATEFDEFVKGLFDKDLFLSLFNPNYFYTLHWEKQRSMVLSYVMAPSNKEVFKELPETQAETLAELVKKKSLDDLDKMHRERKTKLDKELIAAQSRTKTLKEQLDQSDPVEGDLESLEADKVKLTDAIAEADKLPAKAYKNNQVYQSKKHELDMLQEQVERSKERWLPLRDEVIKDTCRTCEQPLKEESLIAVEEDKNRRKNEYKKQHKELVAKRDAMKEELSKLSLMNAEEERQKVRQLEDARDAIVNSINKLNQQVRMKEQIDQAAKDETDKLTNLKESIFIIDAIKDFRAKEADIQVQKVQGLFTSLSIQLFKEQKNGEQKPHFEIKMDGKEYSKLSLSEKIVAGLELREVLSEQSEIVTPCFVDNSESITKFKEPSGQLIVVRVVEGERLTIKGG